MNTSRAAWIGFLCMAFAAVGLMGLFASYAAPLPLERLLAREQALDEARVAARGPDPDKAIAALRPRLDDSAGALLPVSGDMDARIAAERAAVRLRLQAEAGAVAQRLHWMIVVVTLMSAAFGAAVLHISRRA